MTEISSGSRVVVVGGGLGGLACAALLARRGVSVEVLEAATEVGGLARSRILHGFTFNRGAHALYQGGPAMRVLKRLDIEVRGRAPALRGVVLYGGEQHPLPATPWSMLTSGLLGWRARARLAHIFATVLARSPEALEATSAEAWVQAASDDAALRALLRAMLRLATYCGDLERISAAAALRQLAAASRHGVLYLDGGWQSLVNQLRRTCETAGVKVRTETPVASVQGDQVVLRSGEVVQADAVVVAAPPSVVAKLLGAPASLGSPAKAKVACLDVALSELPEPNGPLLAFDLDEAMYLSVHSSFAALAPEGGAMVHVLRYIQAGESSAARSREALDGMLDRIQPQWRSKVVAEQFFPSMVVTHGVPLAEAGGARPDIASGVAGVWCVGDWVGPTGMLADASLASAARVADAITDAGAVAA